MYYANTCRVVVIVAINYLNLLAAEKAKKLCGKSNALTEELVAFDMKEEWKFLSIHNNHNKIANVIIKGFVVY
jgi:hypothetical protein